ncbi:MAG: tRNA epoxyqueuosine(34) reductase QueG [Bacteroidales bacterium]|nr:tRNA epoxyqueuosine(34) reductase QueG [Bacteroidales bacterium]
MSTNLINIDEKAHGFLDFGAARVDSVDEARRQAFENYLAEGRQGEMSYLARNLEKRFDPRQLVPGAESVLCFLAPYGAAGGGVAGFAQGIDYHKVIKDRLFSVMEELRRQFPAFEGRPFVDSAPVLERYWAVKAGLGFIGQNNFFISPEYGLRTIIGVILCNIPADSFAPHAPLAATECGACGACLRACPTGALRAPFDLDPRRCIAYLTVESHEPLALSLEERQGWRFGCEACMQACPWDKPLTPLPEFETHRAEIAAMDDQAWHDFSQAEFERRFADSGLRRADLDHLKN